MKVKMDPAQQSKRIQEVIQIWNNIDGLFTQMKSTSKISNAQIQEHANNINKLLKSHPNSKFLETFFSHFDQFQSKLNEHINEHQELGIQGENIFSNLDSLNSKFTKWGYASRLGCTQSLIKYN
ncbi:unnamed protein product (macronuclear) [Paramecium tetraurelia]|uniref:Uncharacterized protein n=1 Tax=Paramecium tetraurelia TaxID=5888 RepID=A0CCF5_PARTE|nr:uncharacterized protein GSPATT00037257001 [Paramecium tetraurelia]CAK68472.1 unnamed protein product [Paramecium tetraurelia]|eukprot:XP_001435869.1 hypothetical protein (macronuclear) [Paramecium tetraurelia strain d4-2]